MCLHIAQLIILVYRRYYRRQSEQGGIIDMDHPEDNVISCLDRQYLAIWDLAGSHGMPRLIQGATVALFKGYFARNKEPLRDKLEEARRSVIQEGLNGLQRKGLQPLTRFAPLAIKNNTLGTGRRGSEVNQMRYSSLSGKMISFSPNGIGQACFAGKYRMFGGKVLGKGMSQAPAENKRRVGNTWVSARLLALSLAPSRPVVLSAPTHVSIFVTNASFPSCRYIFPNKKVELCGLFGMELHFFNAFACNPALVPDLNSTDWCVARR